LQAVERAADRVRAQETVIWVFFGRIKDILLLQPSAFASNINQCSDCQLSGDFEGFRLLKWFRIKNSMGVPQLPQRRIAPDATAAARTSEASPATRAKAAGG
jgi:hypothetical protein